MNNTHLLVPCLARHASALELPHNPKAAEFNKMASALTPAQLVDQLNNNPTQCSASMFTYSVMQNIDADTSASEALQIIYGELSLLKLDNLMLTGVKPIMFLKMTKLALAQEMELKEWGAHLLPQHKRELEAMGEEWDDDDDRHYVTCSQSFKTYCSFTFTERGSAAPSCEPFKRLASCVSAIPGSAIQEWRPKK